MFFAICLRFMNNLSNNDLKFMVLDLVRSLCPIGYDVFDNPLRRHSISSLPLQSCFVELINYTLLSGVNPNFGNFRFGGRVRLDGKILLFEGSFIRNIALFILNHNLTHFASV